MVPPSDRKWRRSHMPPPISRRNQADLSSEASTCSNKSFTSTAAVASPPIPASKKRSRYDRRSVSPALSSTNSHRSRQKHWHVRDILKRTHEYSRTHSPSPSDTATSKTGGSMRKQTSGAKPKTLDATQGERRLRANSFSPSVDSSHQQQVIDLTMDDREHVTSPSNHRGALRIATQASPSRKKQRVDGASSSSSSSSSSDSSSSSSDDSSGSEGDESIGSISNKAVLGEQRFSQRSSAIQQRKVQAVVTPPQSARVINRQAPRAISASRALAKTNRRSIPISPPKPMGQPEEDHHRPTEKQAKSVNRRVSRTLIRPGDTLRDTIVNDEVPRMQPQRASYSNRQAATSTRDISNNGSTHIIFAIDFSASMSTRDVEAPQKDRPMSRWDAVFLLIEGFVHDQLERVGPGVGRGTVSVFVFNEHAKVLLHRCPMESPGEANPLSRSLHAAHKKYTPYGGTSFTTCFEKAFELATTNRTMLENVVLIMISDGRPGDLSAKPPAPGVPMRAMVRRYGVQIPSAGKYLDRLRNEFKGKREQGRLALHFMCLYKDGRPWLKYLAHQYKGSFHNPDLMMGTDNDPDYSPPIDEMPRQDSRIDGHQLKDTFNGQDYCDTPSRDIRQVSAGETTASEEHDDDEVIQMKPAESLWSVFATISSSVTAMRTGTSQELLERAVTLQETSPMARYKATRMVCNPRTNKCVPASGEKINSRMVRIAQHPFKQGGLRNVYRLRQSGIPRQVAKESRHDISYRERLRFHVQSQKCQDKAIFYATAFNNRLTRLRRQRPCRALDDIQRNITVLKSDIYRLKDDLVPGGYRYISVEPEMSNDGIYIKYNGNNGYVKKEDTLQCQLAQAFSHFSYRYSEKEEMVVDIQGHPYKYTDPQIHSKSKIYGRGDRGEKGFSDFFRTHKCSGICAAFGLKVLGSDS